MAHLTRREINGLLFASAAAGLAPASATAETAESLAFKLAEALNGRVLEGCGARFSVPKERFELSGTRNNVVMRAVVRLDWTPGVRTRPYRSTGTNQQDAIVDMFRQTLVEFHKAMPECLRV